MNFNLLQNNNPGKGAQSRLAQFEDPFIVPSNTFVPQNLDTALDFSLMLYYMNATYRRASIRTAAHFVTDLDITSASGEKGGASKEEKAQHYDYLMNQVDLMGHLMTMGQEFAALGNSFWRMHYPFKRWLVDDRSGKTALYALNVFDGHSKYHYKEVMYEVPDPKGSGPLSERKKIKLPFQDRADLTEYGKSKIRPVPLDPKRIFILASHISKECQYVYEFEEWYVQEVKEGLLHQVNSTPLAMLKAISQDQSFLFEEDQIFHFKAPTVSGVNAKGWGIPETLLNYRELHQVQVYRKIDEQIGMDFMVPFRVFSPSLSGSQVTDAMMQQHLGMWSDKIGKMIQQRRADPLAMHAFPFPIEYNEFGANGRNLVPKDLIQYQNESMLDAMGYPAELYKGSLTIQQVPTALRLFESSFNFMPRGFNRFCQWVSNKILSYLGQPLIEVSLQKPRMADDLEARHVYLQLAAGGEISRAKAYAPFGVKDPMAEVQERLEEDMQLEEMRADLQESFERKQQMGSVGDQIDAQQQAAAEQQAAQQGGGAPAPGGAPVAPPVNPNASVLDVMGQAEQMAMQALQIPSDGERTKFMQQIKASNPTLHSAMKQKMEEMRSQGASQGRASVGAQ
jgi:hypothetical protein